MSDTNEVIGAGYNHTVSVRRLCGFVVAGSVVSGFARAGRRTIEVSSPIPVSAEFFSAYFDHARNSFVCVFEDASFQPVAEGSLIPVVDGPKVTVASSDHDQP